MKKLIALVLVAVLVASVVLLPINMAESGEGTTSTKTTVDTGDLTISKSLGTKAKYDSVTGGYSEEATGNDHSLYEHNLDTALGGKGNWSQYNDFMYADGIFYFGHLIALEENEIYDGPTVIGNDGEYRYDKCGDVATFDLVTGSKLDKVGEYDISYDGDAFTITVRPNDALAASGANLSMSNEILKNTKSNDFAPHGSIPYTGQIWTSSPGQQEYSFDGNTFTFEPAVDIAEMMFVYMHLSLNGYENTYGAGADATFDVKVTGPEYTQGKIVKVPIGSSITLKGIKLGTYTIEEIEKDWNAAYLVDGKAVAGPAVVDLTKNGAKVTIKNEPAEISEPGDLTVGVEIFSEGITALGAESFDVRVTGNEYPAGKIFTIEAGATITLEGIAAGDYLVEQLASGWKTTYYVNGGEGQVVSSVWVNVPAGGESTVMIVNELIEEEETFDLFVIKYVESEDKIVYPTAIQMIDSMNGKYALGVGFTFELYDADDNLVDTQTTGTDGKVTFEGLSGSYYVVEVMTEEQAELYTFGAQGDSMSVGEGKNLFYNDFIVPGDDPELFDLFVIKYVESVEQVIYPTSVQYYDSMYGKYALGVGFTFELYDADDNLKDTQTTGTDGKVTFEGLSEGSYYVVEVMTPEQELLYKFGAQGDSMSVGEGKNLFYNDFIVPDDDETYYTATVTKYVGEDAMEGFTFKLFLVTDEGNVYIGKDTTGADGTATFTGLEDGQYFFKEVMTEEQSLLYEFGEQGETIAAYLGGNVDFYNVLIPDEITYTATVTKLVGEDAMEGFTFELFMVTEDGDVYIGEETTGADGTATFSDLVYGEYYFKEVMTEDQQLNYEVGEQGDTIAALLDGNVDFYNELIIVDDGSHTVTLIKYTEICNEEWEVAGGFWFTLYLKVDGGEDIEIDTKKTGPDGKIEFTDLEFGEYYVIENLTDEQKLMYNFGKENPDGKIDVTLNGTSVFINDYKRYTVTVTKWVETGLESGEYELGEGFVFELYDQFGKYIDTEVTDENGVATFTNLVFSWYYTASEELTGAQKKVYAFGDENPKGEVKILYPDLDVNFYNKNTIGYIEVTKYVESGDGYVLGGEGFIFNLYDSDDKLIDTQVTDAYGVAVFNNIPWGSYYVMEELTGALSDLYVISALNPTGKIAAIINDNVDFYNDIRYYDVTVTKYVGEDAMEGFTFELFMVTEDGDVYIGEETTGADGTATFTGLVFGEYYFKEVLTEEQSNYFVVGAQGETIAALLDDNVDFYNDVRYYDLYVLKYVESLEKVIYPNVLQQMESQNGKYALGDGFTFELYDADGNLVDTQTTGADGKAFFTGLVYGEYYVVEVLTDDQALVYVGADGDTMAVEFGKNLFFNDFVLYDLTVTKYIEICEQDYEVKGGFEFLLYKVVEDGDDILIGSQITGADGTATFTGLVYGEYYVVEKMTEAQSLVFVVGAANADGKVIAILGGNVDFYNDLRYYDLTVIKYIQVEGGQFALGEGFRFVLYDEFDVMAGDETTDENGIATFTDLVYGNYYVVEMMTGAQSAIYVYTEGLQIEVALGEENEIYNYLPYGSLTVTKTFIVDEVLLREVPEELKFSFTVTGPEGFYEEFELGNGESITFYDLIPGAYRVTEISVAGWEVQAFYVDGSPVAVNKIFEDDDVLVAVFSDAGSSISTNTLVVVENAYVPEYDITVTKMLEFPCGNYFPNKGFTFELYLYVEDGEDVLIDTQTTGDDGTVTFTVPYGEYYVKEVMTGGQSDRYVFGPDNADGTLDVVLGGNVDFYNDIREYTVTVTKMLEFPCGNYFPNKGFKFELWTIYDEFVADGITGDDGTLTFTVPYGEYYFLEKMTDGQNDRYVFNAANADGKVIAILDDNADFYNDVREYTVTLTKLVGETPMAGFFFELWTAYDEKVGEGVTDENGQISFTVIYGDYYFEETLLGDQLDEYLFGEQNADGTIAAILDDNVNFYNVPSSYTITVTKMLQFPCGNYFPNKGFTFELYLYVEDGEDVLFDTQTTGDDGTVTFTVPYGEYYVKEVMTGGQSDRYVFGPGNENGTLDVVLGGNVNFYNDVKEYFVSLTKLVGETPMEGFLFKLWTEYDELVGDDITGEDGTITFIVPYGEYYFEEILSDEQKLFYVFGEQNEDGTVVAILDNNVSFYNEEIEYTITVTKMLEFPCGNYFPKNGFEFELFLVVEDGDDISLGTMITGADGTVTFTGLAYGEYYVKELMTSGQSARYVFGPDNADGTLAAILNDNVDFYNDVRLYTVTVTKMLQFPCGNYFANSGFKFELYTASDEFVGEGITGDDGTLTFTGLKYGEYYFVEVMTSGQSDRYVFNAANADNKLVAALNDNVNFYNDVREYTVTLTKLVGETPMEGFFFELWTAYDEKVGEGVTDENGKISFTVIYGDYFFEETLLADQLDEYIFGEQNADGKVTAVLDGNVNFYNAPSIVSFTVTKYVETCNEYCEAKGGFWFDLYLVVEGGVDVKVDRQMTNINGIATFTVPYGEYYVIEDMTPAQSLKYEPRDSEKMNITLGTDNPFYNDLKRYTLTVTKLIQTEDGGYVPGEGFTFLLYDDTDMIAGTAITDEDGVATFEDIVWGTYTLVEKMTEDQLLIFIVGEEYPFYVVPGATVEFHNNLISLIIVV